MNKNIPALTSIRGIAALIVLFYHIDQSFSTHNLPFFSWFNKGSLGVDLFFVLSGFIMAYVYHSETSFEHGFIKFYRKFIFVRFARIYPLHIATLLFLLIITLTIEDFTSRHQTLYTLGTFIQNIFLIQNWGISTPSWNMVSWSISAEWFMYLLFPFLLYFSQFIHSAKSYLLLATITLVSHYCIIFALNLDGYGGISIGGMIRVFFEFTLGFLLFFSRDCFRKVFNVLPNFFPILILVGLLISLALDSMWFLFLPLTSLFIISLSLVNSAVSRVLSLSPLVYLGNISYSLYMWHWIILQIQNWLIFNQYIATQTVNEVLIISISTIVISIVVAHYSFNFIEIPSRQYLREKVSENL